LVIGASSTRIDKAAVPIGIIDENRALSSLVPGQMFWRVVHTTLGTYEDGQILRCAEGTPVKTPNSLTQLRRTCDPLCCYSLRFSSKANLEVVSILVQPTAVSTCMTLDQARVELVPDDHIFQTSSKRARNGLHDCAMQTQGSRKFLDLAVGRHKCFPPACEIVPDSTRVIR